MYNKVQSHFSRFNGEIALGKKKKNISILLFVLLLTFSFYKNIYSQWTFVSFVTNAGTNPSISVAGPNLVFIAGGTTGAPLLVRSTNSGVTWTSIPNPAVLELSCVWFNNINTGFIGEGNFGGTAKSYFTTNGGQNWTLLGITLAWNGAVFSRTNPLTGFVVGQLSGLPFGIYKTTNGGINWFTQNPSISSGPPVNNSLFMIDNLFYGFGLSGAASAKIILTSDGGATWINPTLPISGSNVSGLAFKDDKLNGFAATSISLPNIAKTTDGGVTWTALGTGSGVTGNCNIKWIHGSYICYFSGTTGSSGVIKRTSNVGQTWTQMTTNGVAGVTHFEYYKNPATSSINLYAVSNDGSVITYTDNSLVGIKGNESIPVSFKLYQNFPNPFNPSTKIKFDIPTPQPPFRKGGTNVKLIVYDVIGNEVATLVNKELKPGSYEVEFDGSNYASGVYYYRIAIHSDKLIAGDFIETKKMILMK